MAIFTEEDWYAELRRLSGVSAEYMKSKGFFPHEEYHTGSTPYEAYQNWIKYISM